MDFKIDYVFPFVNPFDRIWQKEYAKYFNDNPITNPRHKKSPKLLRFMLRSLAKNMPWIDKLYMIVACPTQVPSWINRDTVNVILHQDIIPEDERPTFNTCTVDKYINSVPGLKEQYVYGHDDYYAVNQIDASQFFTNDGLPIKNPMAYDVRKVKSNEELEEICKRTRWMSICRNAYELFKKKYGNELLEKFPKKLEEPCIVVHRHMFMPQTKSITAEVLNKFDAKTTKFSIARDFTDNMLDCLETTMYITCTGAEGNAPKNIKLPSLNQKVDAAVEQMTQQQFNKYANRAVNNAQCLCINDNNDITRGLYASWLETKFPDKCKYEN